jgi:hypothetical protein
MSPRALLREQTRMIEAQANRLERDSRQHLARAIAVRDRIPVVPCHRCGDTSGRRCCR